MPRTLQELTAGVSAWPVVQKWIAAATNPVEVLPVFAHPHRERALLDAQVGLGTPLGAVVYETGGLLIDHGWLRILGSGHPRLSRGLAAWNRGRSTFPQGNSRGFRLVADDVIGGFFAVNGVPDGIPAPTNASEPADAAGDAGRDAAGGLAFDGPAGEVFYLAPDSFRWEPMGGQYAHFLAFCLAGDLARFYDGCRWEGWRQEVEALGGEEALLLWPSLCMEGPPLAERRRERVPVADLYHIHTDLQRQLADVPEGGTVDLKVNYTLPSARR